MVGTRLAQLSTGAAVCTVLALSGCSSSISPPTVQPAATPAGGAATPAGGATPAGAAPIGSLAPAASSALQQILGATSGGPLDVSKLCAAVPVADVQKLFKATAPSVSAYPGECNWGGGITVDIYFNDVSKQFYNGGGISVSTAKPLSGVGDVAQWSQPVPGMTAPFMAAQKGTTTISVSAGLDVDQTTMPYTGSAPFFKVTAASAAQYAAEEGQICNDLFAAAHA
jgi:hypothetical protein